MIPEASMQLRQDQEEPHSGIPARLLAPSEASSDRFLARPVQGGLFERVDAEGAGVPGGPNLLHQGGLLHVPAALPALQPAHL